MSEDPSMCRVLITGILTFIQVMPVTAIMVAEIITVTGRAAALMDFIHAVVVIRVGARVISVQVCNWIFDGDLEWKGEASFERKAKGALAG